MGCGPRPSTAARSGSWPSTPVGSAGSGDELDALDDERLALILLCCHPAVHPEARAPLALRLVVGTTTEEIARLHLVSVATMAARITRAKKKIVIAGIPLSSPVDDELRTRLDGVCRTIYLAFTAGYAPARGADLLREDLAAKRSSWLQSCTGWYPTRLRLARCTHSCSCNTPAVTPVCAMAAWSRSVIRIALSGSTMS